MRIFKLAVFAVILGLSWSADQSEVSAQNRSAVFTCGENGSKYYRIPAIVTAADGSLVVVADKRWETNGDLPGHIDVVCRRSTDNGATWSDPVTVAATDCDGGYGDPALVLDRKTGDLLCISTHGQGLWTATPGNNAHIVVSRSRDGGKSWGAPHDITSMIYPAADAERQWITAFASSGRALQLADGRLMFVLVVRDEMNTGKTLKCYSCFSDDGGVTWRSSALPADPNGDEAKVAQLPDGRVMMSIRNRWQGKRHFAFSEDRGETWSEVIEHPDLDDPACNGDLITIKANGETLLLQTLPWSEKERRNVSIFRSRDNGATWQPAVTVCPGGSAYSTLTQLPDGSIGCVVEENDPDGDGFNLWFTQIPLQQIW